MTAPIVTPENAKTAMTAAGYATSPGSNWTAQDDAAYTQFVSDLSYAAGVFPNDSEAQYGLAYPAVMPPAVADAVGADLYSATLAGAPLTGAYATTPVTWTLTETNGPATSYAWNMGDGSAIQTTTVPNVTYTYTAAGTYTASVRSTVDSVIKPAIMAAAPAILT